MIKIEGIIEKEDMKRIKREAAIKNFEYENILKQIFNDYISRNRKEKDITNTIVYNSKITKPHGESIARKNFLSNDYSIMLLPLSKVVKYNKDILDNKVLSSDHIFKIEDKEHILIGSMMGKDGEERYSLLSKQDLEDCKNYLSKFHLILNNLYRKIVPIRSLNGIDYGPRDTVGSYV